jgi:hypothetical protein
VGGGVPGSGTNGLRVKASVWKWLWSVSGGATRPLGVEWMRKEECTKAGAHRWAPWKTCWGVWDFTLQTLEAIGIFISMMWCELTCFYLFIYLFVSLVWTQGLTLVRQILYNLSQVSSPNLLVCKKLLIILLRKDYRRARMEFGRPIRKMYVRSST